MMNHKNEHLAEAASLSVENAHEFLQTSLEGIEKIAKLQLDSSKKILEDTSKALQDISRTTDAKDFFTRVGQLANHSIESNICNCKELYEILSEVQVNVSKLIETNLQHTQQNIATAVDGLSKYNTATSGASESVKNWMENANQAVNTMQKVAQQVTEFTTKNIKAASEATINATKKAAKK